VLARNFKTIEKATLYLAFFINVILLFHRVEIGTAGSNANSEGDSETGISEGSDEESIYITGMTLPYWPGRR
jgi:hypothetical protein